MVKLSGNAGWGGGQWSGGMRVWWTVLLFLCGFCSKTGGDISIETTIFITSDVTVAVTEDWGTKTIPSRIVASSTSSPQEGSLSPTTPLDQVSMITSQPEDVSTLYEILATSTAVFTEPYISTLYEDPESSGRVKTSSQSQPSLPMLSSVKDTIGAFTPGDIWATSTADVTEQYTTTVFENRDDTMSVDISVASEQIVSSSAFIDNPLTRSHSTLESTLQPSSLFISQRTDFVTEWSTVLDSSQSNLETHLPESARTILPNRTNTLVPSTLFPRLPVSLQPTPFYPPDTETFSEGYSATPPLLDETLIVTSDIIVTIPTTPLGVSETPSEDQLRSPTLSQSSDTLSSDVVSQMLSTGLSNPQLTLISHSAQVPSSFENFPVESTIILSSVLYITESTDILQPVLPTTHLFTPLMSPVLSTTSPLQTNPTVDNSDIPSYVFQTETIEFVETSKVGIPRTLDLPGASSPLSLVDQSIRTSEGPSMGNSKPVADVSTDVLETVIVTVTSDMVYTPSPSPSFATPSNRPVMSSASRSTVFVPSVESSNIPSVNFGTEIITSEIYTTIQSELTPGLTRSAGLVHSELSTLFEEPTPTPSLTLVNSMPRSYSSNVSSTRQTGDSEVLWLTSEVVETLVVSSERIVRSETFSYSGGSSDVSISTSFFEVTSQGVKDTVSVYETVTIESTLPIPTILPSPKTLQLESNLQSAFDTSDQSMVVPATTNSMLYSTVVELVTSDMAVTDDLLRSSRAVASLSPTSPPTFHSMGSFDSVSLQTTVYETVTINTEFDYSTLIQSPSLLPSPGSTVHPEITTQFPSSSCCASSCTCTSPPPSLPPPLCSRSGFCSSVKAPSSTLSLDYTVEESFVIETMIITSDVILYPTPDTYRILPSSDMTPLISLLSSDVLSTVYSESQVLPSQTLSLPILSTASQPDIKVTASPYFPNDSIAQSETENLKTLIYTSYFVETFDFLEPSSDIMPTDSIPVYTYPTRTPEFTYPMTLSDKNTSPETMFRSVYETQTSDVFISLVQSMELSDSLTYSESSRYSDILDVSQVMSTNSGLPWTDIYEIITTEVYEYVTTEFYDSGTPGTSTEEYQVSTIFPTLSTPNLQTDSTLQLTASGEIPSLSSVMETSVLPTDTSVTSYEISSVLYTPLEMSTIMPITPSMQSVHPTSDSTVMFSSEFGITYLESPAQSVLFSTIVDVSTILVSDTITDAISILPTTSDYYPTPSTPSFSSSLLPSLPTFPPLLPSYTQTPSLDVSSVMVYTTLALESPFSSRSTEDLTSLVTAASDTVSHLSSFQLPSDFLTETLLTSEVVTADSTETFPAMISSTADYLTLVMSRTDTIGLSSDTGTLGTVSTKVVESSTSETPPLLTPIESLQISSLDTFMYTTTLDTFITSTVVTPSTAVLEYSSSVLATSMLHTLSSEIPEVSTSEVYGTKSSETTDFASYIVPTYITSDLWTSSLDIMPGRSTVVVATSIEPTVQTSFGSSIFLETFSIITLTSEVEESTYTYAPTRMPIVPSLDTHASLISTGSYSSMISQFLTTIIPVQTTDYVISTVIGPTTSVSETYILTDELTPKFVSSAYATIESSGVSSQVVTDTVSLGSLVVSSDLSTLTALIPSPSDSLKIESSSFLATLSGTPQLTSMPSSGLMSQVITETVSLGSPVVSSDLSTPTALIPSPSDSLKIESSSFLATLSEIPPLTSMPSLTTSALLQSVGSSSVLLSELTSTFSAPFSFSELFLSSSMAPQSTTAMIIPTASQLVTPSTLPTLPPVTSTTESPIDVPEQFQLTMYIKVPTSEDITAEEFSENLSNNLEVLYIEGEENDIVQRRRRSNRGADTLSGDHVVQEWIFTRKRNSNENFRNTKHLELLEQNVLNEEPQFEGLAKESSAEMEWMFVSKQMGRTSPKIQVRTEGKVRRKRQTDPSDEIEVPILTLSRADDTDPETVTVTFYVMENDSLVLATDSAATYGTLTEGEMSAQLGYAVRSMPQPVIPTPTATPDYPFTIPSADQTDWLKVTLLVDAAFDESNATFKKQLRNDLEFLYVNGSDASEGNIARTRRDLGRWYPGDDVILEAALGRGRRAADPSSVTEVALESVDRPEANAEDVNVVFYVVDEGTVIPGAMALVPYQQFSLQELQDVTGYEVVYPGVTLFLTATPTGLAWWWYLLIALIALLLIIVIFLIVYYYCWAKKTAIKTLNKVDRSTSVELGFLRLEKEPKARVVVMETAFSEKASKRSNVNGSASREADQERLTNETAQKRKKKKRSKRAQESAREYTKRGYLSGEDDQLFSHVDTHSTKEKTKKPANTSRLQNNSVYPEPQRLPPLRHRSLVAYSETESEISNEQLRMMRKAGMPKSWYTTHIDKDPEELMKDIAREKKRQRRKKEKKIQDQLTAEQMQKEFDAVLGGLDEQGIKNPTARQVQVTRTDRWKAKDMKRKREIPDSTGVIDESAVRLIRTRPLESAAPPATDHEAIKKEIEELLKRGPPKPVQEPFSKTASVSQEEAKELTEKKEREVRLRRKWAEERKRINRILDEAFALSSTSLGSPRDQTKGDGTPTTRNGQSSAREREFNKDLEDSGYLRHRGYYDYDTLDDSSLPGMIPGRMAMPTRSIPLYETSLGLDLSGERLYDSIRRPPIEYEFLPSQMRSNGSAPAYGVSVSPVRTQRAPRVAPYPPRDFLGTDPYRSLNSSLSSSLQPMQITPRSHHMDGAAGMGHQQPASERNDEGQDIIRVQEENLSLQRLVAKQQRELDHALALIGQPNSRIGQSEKSESKEGKVGSNGRKQRRVVPVNSAKPLNGPSTVSAWTDDHKAVERTSHPLTSTPNKDNMIKVKPRPSQKEGSVVLEHHIEKPGKGSMNDKDRTLHS